MSRNTLSLSAAAVLVIASGFVPLAAQATGEEAPTPRQTEFHEPTPPGYVEATPEPSPSVRPNEGSHMGGDIPPELLPSPIQSEPAPEVSVSPEPAPVVPPATIPAPVQVAPTPVPVEPVTAPSAAVQPAPVQTAPSVPVAPDVVQQVAVWPTGGADTGV